MAITRNMSYVQEVTAKDKEDKPISKDKKIVTKLDLLDQKMNSLYKDIYISRPDNKDNLNTIVDKLDTSIDRLQKSNIDVSGMSELIRRVDTENMPNTKKYMESVQSLFENENLINSLFMQDTVRRFIMAQNGQYDLICRYLPRLLDAIEIKRDLVLSSDNFSKNFINPKSVKSNKKDVERFTANAKRLEKEYDFSNFVIKTYDNVSKYGEDFIYIVPYQVAFKRLLKKANMRASNPKLGQYSFFESGGNKQRSSSYLNKQTIVTEGFGKSREFQSYIETVKDLGADTDYYKDFTGGQVTLHYNESGMISEKINEAIVVNNLQLKYLKESAAFAFDSDVSIHEKTLQQDYEKLKQDNDGLSASVSDGLITPDILNKDPEKIDKNFTGAVLERIKRENIVPVYIGKKCVGYYYLEFAEDMSACGYCGGVHSQMPGVSSGINYGARMSEDQQELAIRFISAKISRNIDAKFINANKDLKEEIYSILRYNEHFDISRSADIGVTFIPAEDIIHCYSVMDEDTHRGISDLERAVIPAMLYILLYLTDIIGKITRSTDKRVYYVKQNVEANIARTMMNVVAQIKKGNMGVRQLESMNNILNIVGKYNDYLIPVGPSGDSPIQFDILQGQDINTPTDMMEKMEEAAINTIMPMELVNATFNQDFATSYSYSNSRVVRSVFTRQGQTQRWISPMFTKIYNYEFNESYNIIEVILPPPVYLVMNSSQQLIDNISQMADKIIESEMPNEDDEVKQEFKKVYLRNYLSTYIDYDNIERMMDIAKMNVETKKPAATEDGEASDMYGEEDY